MNEHWDKLIERVLTNDIGMDDKQVREACLDAEFAERLVEAMEVVSGLEQDQLLAQAMESRQQSGEQSVVDLAERELRRIGSLRRRWIKATVALLVAASLLLVVFHEPPQVSLSPERDISLGAGGLQCLVPEGPGADLSLFQWENDLRGGSYRVELLDKNDDPLPLGISKWLGNVREWRPSDEKISGWSQINSWKVTWRKPGVGMTVSATANASP